MLLVGARGQGFAVLYISISMDVEWKNQAAFLSMYNRTRCLAFLANQEQLVKSRLFSSSLPLLVNMPRLLLWNLD